MKRLTLRIIPALISDLRKNILKYAKCAVILLIIAGFFSCVKSESETDTDIAFKTHYYWSGGKKIWLDTDFSVMIVQFDSEESLDDFLSSTPFPTAQKLSANNFLATVWRQSKSDEIFRKLDYEKSIINKTFGHRFHNSDVPFWLTGYIMLRPKEGISVDEILEKFRIDVQITTKWTDGCVVIQLNDWNNIIELANAIYESGMVEWCHPDFFTIISHGF